MAVVFLVTGISGLNMIRAQENRHLTLEEAVALGVQNSKSLKFSKARIDEAIAAVQEAKDHRLPDVKVSGSYLRINEPNISMKQKSSGNGGSESTPSVSQLGYGMATVSYPIYSGSRIRYGIESAKFLEMAARLDAENDREEVVLNTVNAFINLYKSSCAVELMQENLQQSRLRDKDFSNLEKNGLLARNELLKAQLQTSNYELALLDAENNHKLANVNMNLLLGLPESQVLLPDSSFTQRQVKISSMEEFEQLALQHRKDLQSLEQKHKAAGLNVKSVHAEMYPTVGLTGGYVAADIPGLLSVTNAVNAGIGVQYSLSSLWKTKAKVHQAQAREEQLNSQQAIVEDQIRLGINKAYQDYLLSQKKIDVYRRAIDQAAENYRITKNKYDNSLVTTTDLLDADVAALQAKLNYAFARADAQAAYHKLLQTAGLTSGNNL